MFLKKEIIKNLNNSIDKILKLLQEENYIELAYLLGNKKEMFKRNLLAGIFRGIGIGIGVTIITAIIIMLLQKIVTLNIPIIGEFIADIVKIVETNK